MVAKHSQPDGTRFGYTHGTRTRDLLPMNYQEFAPHALLSNYIQCFWRITRDFKPIGGVLDVLPDGYIEIIFNIGSPCWVDDGCSRWELPACYIVSHFDKPLRLQTSGVLKTFGVRL